MVTTTTGRELNGLAADWLFVPAGARTAQFYERRTAQFAPIGLLARASDLTAIGQSVIDVSQPGLPSGWIDHSFESSQSINEAYGYLWWLNGQESFRLPRDRVSQPGALIPSAPTDLAAALGKDDQKLYVSRELDLVVARTRREGDPGGAPRIVEIRRSALGAADDAPVWLTTGRPPLRPIGTAVSGAVALIAHRCAGSCLR